MKITQRVSMTMHKNGEVTITINGIDIVKDKDIMVRELTPLYKDCSFKSESERENLYAKYEAEHKIPHVVAYVNGSPVEEKASPKEKPFVDTNKIVCNAINGMINFFSEFQFTPNYRFVNTLVKHLATGTNGTAYIENYFRLIDSPYANDVQGKIKSPEFNAIINDLSNYAKPTQSVNNRLRIYFGAAGCGKTHKAMEEVDGRRIICNASMLPADLIEDFTFDDGKATFHPSILVECMEKGLPILLDEINLLPFDSLRFLQGICDGEKEFTYKGRHIQINDGFCIVGTMNLVVNGVSFGLPEPLVDRCAEITEFTLTPEMLMRAI